MNSLYHKFPTWLQKHETLEERSFTTLFQKHTYHVERNILEVQLESQEMKMFWKHV